MPETSEITQINTIITALEQKLTTKLTSGIWIYAPILDPSINQELVIKDPDPETIQLLKNYLAEVNKLVIAFEQPEIKLETDNAKPEVSNIIAGFKKAMIFLYKIRFTAARLEYADYCLRRIRTPLERKILTAGHYDNAQTTDILYLINLPGAIQVFTDGSIDIKTTQENEQKNHAIKTYFSVIPSTHAHSKAFYNMFFRITSKGMVPRLYESEIKKLGEQLMAVMLAGPVHEVYTYLDRGYTVTQSIANVQNYYSKIITEQKNRLQPEFAITEAKIEQVCKQALDRIKPLSQETKNDITDEMKGIIPLFFNTGAMLPSNYYKVEFRKPHPNNPDEAYFEYLLDSFLLDSSTTFNGVPIETYGFELTMDAKTAIFETVTNGQVNLQYTLNDYLGYQEYQPNA